MINFFPEMFVEVHVEKKYAVSYKSYQKRRHFCQRQLSLTFLVLVILDPAENKEGSSQTHKLGPFYEVSPLHVESPELFSKRVAGGGITHLNEKVSRLVQLGLT